MVGLDEVEADEATAGRMFRLLVPCPSATQFVGYIPPGRAPDHYHRYDEVVYVLEGNGALHIDGESTPLRPGSCIHLPAKLVHSLENHGPGEMQVLGVFRPAGSPAEAYYPDGTPAVPVLMPRIERSAQLVWEGNVARGVGRDQRGHGSVRRSRLLAADAHRPARGEDQPRGIACGRARRLHHDVARLAS